jgi:polar amino acid transport system substrate-binding protein
VSRTSHPQDTAAAVPAGLLAKGVLRLACIDSEALPLFDLSPDGGRTRTGYEPDAAALVAEEIGASIEWTVLPWDQMLPAVRDGRADAVWCGQGIIPSRQEQVDFTRPYAIFNESVLVRADDPAQAPEDFAGRRVAAIEGSANMRLAETFPGAVLVPFASTGDVFGDMIRAVRDGTVDAMVDDDVVTVPLGEDPDFRIAFTAPTRNPWGVGVAKDRPDLLQLLDEALGRVIDSGRLQDAWSRWMPRLPFPGQLHEGRRS